MWHTPALACAVFVRWHYNKKSFQYGASSTFLHRSSWTMLINVMEAWEELRVPRWRVSGGRGTGSCTHNQFSEQIKGAACAGVTEITVNRYTRSTAIPLKPHVTTCYSSYTAIKPVYIKATNLPEMRSLGCRFQSSHSSPTMFFISWCCVATCICI